MTARDAARALLAKYKLDRYAGLLDELAAELLKRDTQIAELREKFVKQQNVEVTSALQWADLWRKTSRSKLLAELVAEGVIPAGSEAKIEKRLATLSAEHHRELAARQQRIREGLETGTKTDWEDIKRIDELGRYTKDGFDVP
jgi:hypothetical protein